MLGSHRKVLAGNTIFLPLDLNACTVKVKNEFLAVLMLRDLSHVMSGIIHFQISQINFQVLFLLLSLTGRAFGEEEISLQHIQL